MLNPISVILEDALKHVLVLAIGLSNYSSSAAFRTYMLWTYFKNKHWFNYFQIHLGWALSSIIHHKPTRNHLCVLCKWCIHDQYFHFGHRNDVGKLKHMDTVLTWTQTTLDSWLVLVFNKGGLDSIFAYSGYSLIANMLGHNFGALWWALNKTARMKLLNINVIFCYVNNSY